MSYAPGLRRSLYCTMAILIAILLGTSAVFAQNQQITVKGVVVDDKNEAIIGATVLEDGTKNGTVTDFDGNFSIKTASNATLTISYVGYNTQKVKASASALRIVLKEDTETLEEVVVVGYGTVKRANLTGAVSNIDMKEVADIPAPNLASVLVGTMPGVNVGEATGNPIGNTTIKVRINGSWNA